MALTPLFSAEFSDYQSKPKKQIEAWKWGSKVRSSVAKYTPTVAAQGTAQVIRLPAGKIRVFPDLSRMASPAGAAGATLSVGYESYTRADGTVVAADPVAFANAVVITAAVDQALPLPTAPYLDLDSQDGVTIFITIATANGPAAGDINLVFVYAQGN